MNLEFFKKYSSDRVVTSNIVKKFLEKNEDIKLELENILFKIPEYENIRNIIISIVFNKKLKKCKTCGKILPFSKINLNYCSSKCSNSNENVKKLKEKTFLNHYGVKSNFQTDEFKKQSKETSLKKYGVTHPLKNKKIYEKVKRTCLKKYGNEFLQQCENIKEKSKESLKEKYNVENISYLNRLNTIKKWKDYIIPLFDLKDYGKSRKYKWKCVKCGNEFESEIYSTHHIKNHPYLPRCLKCYPFLSGFSYKEKDLFNFCKIYFPNLIENAKSLIKPFELDIIIPEIKLALEFNGLYWHDINRIDKNYHLNKVIKCNEKGYRLIHIWEDEWDNKEEIKRKLIDIFEGKEVINYSKPLDRSWYNNLEGEFEELPPEIVIRNGFEVENCGYLIYNKIKVNK